MPMSYTANIRPLFRDKDVSSMLTFGRPPFDLSKYEDVVDNADDIFSKLDSGKMPCDGAWPRSNVNLFQQWMKDGKLP